MALWRISKYADLLGMGGMTASASRRFPISGRKGLVAEAAGSR
jgi:hypothetical protein